MEDIEDMLSNWSGFLRQFDYSKIKPKIYSNARAIAMGRLKNLMLREAQRAISKVEEFQYGPLEKQLLENLSRREHYRISPDLSTVELLDKSVIGTFGDLIEGARYAARATGAVGGGTQQQRLYGWKWGIYKPGREGVKKCGGLEDYPDYGEIIDLRLRYWGDKAPYWYILNYGNAGGAEAYPSNEPTNFIEIVRSRAQGILQKSLEMAAEDILSGMEHAVEEQDRKAETEIVRVWFERVEVGRAPSGARVQVAPTRKKTGELYYMLVVGGRYTGKIRPGEAIIAEGKTMGTFNP